MTVPSTFLRKSGGEAVFITVLLVACAVLYYMTFSFRNVPWDTLGLSFWPRALLIALFGCGIWRLSRLIAVFRSGTQDEDRREDRAFLKGVAAWVFCAAYLPLLFLFGFVVASLIFLIAFCAAVARSLDFRTLGFGAVVASVIVAVVWVLFHNVLGTDLPGGVLFN